MAQSLIRPKLSAALILSMAALVGLAGCGGGGGSSTPAAPTVQLALSLSSVSESQASVLTWSSTNATSCIASGSWSGTKATSGSINVSQAAAGSYTYNLNCASANASVVLTAVATANVNNSLSIVIDKGPNGDSFNMPFVTVTVCTTGTTICQAIDHVLVDTGSYGLRVFSSVMGKVSLPPVLNASSTPVAACGQFVSGYMWGSVRRADVKLAGEVATNTPVEIVGDTGSTYATIPAACNNTGAAMQTAVQLGANGVLGVGLFNQDCPGCAVSTAPNVYFACTANGCTSTVLPASSQVANPVAAFAKDNNGVVITLPAVSASGASVLNGSLIIGIGTQTNNQVGAAVVYPTNSAGNITTTYKGVSYTASFLDSGSNGLFFDDSSIAQCDNFYCPAEGTLSLSATTVSPVFGASGLVNFSVSNINSMQANTGAFNAGGKLGITNSFDWGLPFFFGRTVYVAIEGASTPKGAGPYWAY